MINSLVLVINSGSSSLKFAVIDAQFKKTVLSGLAECLGLPDARISWKHQEKKLEAKLTGDSSPHKLAVDHILNVTHQLNLSHHVVAVGHRIVHGGEYFTKTTKITPDVIAQIEKLVDLAPLHNPASVLGIYALLEALPNIPQFAVFDTAFHQTMPERAFMGTISHEFYEQYRIRRYGFHGTSHYYVSRQAAKMLDKPVTESNFISLHLGNGASVCAIANGKSVDTSMGFTPLSGLMMGTRCGDLDPSIIEFLLKKGLSTEEVFDHLNKKSGLLGVSGLTSDARGILEAMEQGHEGARLAFEIFTYRVAKYIGSYLIPLQKLDAIIFTGGIGENALAIRSKIIEHLSLFDFIEDKTANEKARFGNGGIIASSPLLNAKVLVIPTNEELVIVEESITML